MFRANLPQLGACTVVGVPKFNDIKWKFLTSGRAISSPAMVNGVVYVGRSDCNLYAIDAGSGSGKMEI